MSVPTPPGTDPPGTHVPGTDLPGTDLPGTDLPGTDLPGTGAVVPRTRRWATLTPEALEDEIEANRRGERWVVVASAVGALVTAVAVVLQAVTR